MTRRPSLMLCAMKTPRCARTATLGQVQSAVNVVSDFYLLVIPIRAVWTLQMPRRERLGVIGIFMVGLMSVCEFNRRI